MAGYRSIDRNVFEGRDPKGQLYRRRRRGYNKRMPIPGAYVEMRARRRCWVWRDGGRNKDALIWAMVCRTEAGGWVVVENSAAKRLRVSLESPMASSEEAKRSSSRPSSPASAAVAMAHVSLGHVLDAEDGSSLGAALLLRRGQQRSAS